MKRCARCQAGISSSELVMRARDLVFHLHCFTCASCGTALAKGDQFGLRDGIIYCRPHYELLYTSPHFGYPPCPAASAEVQYFAAMAAAAAATAGASGGAATPGPGAQGAALNNVPANAPPSSGSEGSSAAAAAVAAAAALAAAAAVVQKGRPRKRKLPSVEASELPLSLRHPSGSLGKSHQYQIQIVSTHGVFLEFFENGGIQTSIKNLESGFSEIIGYQHLSPNELFLSITF